MFAVATGSSSEALSGVLPAGFAAGLVLAVERLEDARPQTLLQLEEDADPGQVHAQVLGEMPDPEDPAQIVLRVEPDVGGGAGWTDQPFTLIDAQRSRVNADQLGSHTDDVDR